MNGSVAAGDARMAIQVTAAGSVWQGMGFDPFFRKPRALVAHGCRDQRSRLYEKAFGTVSGYGFVAAGLVTCGALACGPSATITGVMEVSVFGPIFMDPLTTKLKRTFAGNWFG